jgi:putative zinc finger/helix-turn-helix YgiT family protein
MESSMTNCDECGGPVTVERSAVRRYDIGGLPHVELRGVDVSACSKCGKESITIPRIGQLHRLLAEMFVKSPRMLAPVEIRFLRKYTGHSTVDFAKLFGVERETVSRWESGANPASRIADRLIRLFVMDHQPTESYAVDDLLNSLTDAPPPTKLNNVVMRNSKTTGWKPDTRQLASV